MTQPNYLTAKAAQARTIAARALNGNYMRAETDAVIARIAAAADKGINSIYIPTADPTVLNRLNELGYTVHSTSDQRDGQSTTVTW